MSDPSSSVQRAGETAATPYINESGNTWTIGARADSVARNGGQTIPAVSRKSLSASGAVDLSLYYGSYKTFTVNMTGNVTRVHLMNTGGNIAGLLFALEFIQPASGGPYTLPSTCATTGWQVTTGAGPGIVCPGGVAPAANPTAGSATLVWFYDDGTSVLMVGTNYNSAARRMTTNGTANQVR